MIAAPRHHEQCTSAVELKQFAIGLKDFPDFPRGCVRLSQYAGLPRAI
jgi:hypothetical protein